MIHYILLEQQAEEHVTAGKMALEYVGFLSYFAVYGALGFHFQVLKVLRSEKSINVAGSPVDRADRRAGTLGLVGALLMVVTLTAGLSSRAAEKHITIMSVVNAGDRVHHAACYLFCAFRAADESGVSGNFEWLDHSVDELGLAVLGIRQEADQDVITGVQTRREKGVASLDLPDNASEGNRRRRRRLVRHGQPGLEILHRFAGQKLEQSDFVWLAGGILDANDILPALERR
jgi:hypothetical protein